MAPHLPTEPRGEVPGKHELTASQWRTLARIRARRPDALLFWERRSGGRILEISAPPTVGEPYHLLVTIAFESDGSIRVERKDPAHGHV
jgi:hypothetical protein